MAWKTGLQESRCPRRPKVTFVLSDCKPIDREESALSVWPSEQYGLASVSASISFGFRCSQVLGSLGATPVGELQFIVTCQFALNCRQLNPSSQTPDRIRPGTTILKRRLNMIGAIQLGPKALAATGENVNDDAQ